MFAEILFHLVVVVWISKTKKKAKKPKLSIACLSFLQLDSCDQFILWLTMYYTCITQTMPDLKFLYSFSKLQRVLYIRQMWNKIGKVTPGFLFFFPEVPVVRCSQVSLYLYFFFFFAPTTWLNWVIVIAKMRMCSIHKDHIEIHVIFHVHFIFLFVHYILHYSPQSLNSQP